MPASLAPFGLQPVRAMTPQTTNFAPNIYTIAYNNSHTFGQGDLVQMSGGYMDGAVAYNTAPVLGVFNQCFYQPANPATVLTPNYNIQWNAPSLASTTTVTGWVWDSRDIVFRIQANGTCSQTMIGLNATIVANANASNGYSQVSLDVVTHAPATTSTYPMRIVGVWQGVNNALTDAYPILEVMLNDTNLWTTTGQ
ncbi:MAG: hypothetical protein KGL39_03700 [Patescibacteria group bacterium]|nr:hypothetical protein [Patescibacteria group bacterium]